MSLFTPASRHLSRKRAASRATRCPCVWVQRAPSHPCSSARYRGGAMPLLPHAQAARRGAMCRAVARGTCVVLAACHAAPTLMKVGRALALLSPPSLFLLLRRRRPSSCPPSPAHSPFSRASARMTHSAALPAPPPLRSHRAQEHRCCGHAVCGLAPS